MTALSKLSHSRAGQNKRNMFSLRLSAMCHGVSQLSWCLRDSLKLVPVLFLFLLIIPFSLHGNQGTEIGGEISTLLCFIFSYSHYVSMLQ